jgi:CheY-like chemotaxis protein
MVTSIMEQRPLGGVRALVVEDDRDARELVAMVLIGAGAHVTQASCAVDALQLAREHAFDIVLSDVAMPEHDGHELIGHLRANGVHALAVAVTGRARNEDRARALDAGFDDHLAKPVAPDQLVAHLAERLRQRQSQPG